MTLIMRVLTQAIVVLVALALGYLASTVPTEKPYVLWEKPTYKQRS